MYIMLLNQLIFYPEQILYKDDFELENTLAISKRLSSVMESLLGAIQRQLSVNALAITREGWRFNYGQTIMVLLYIMTYIMHVSMVIRSLVLIG